MADKPRRTVEVSDCLHCTLMAAILADADGGRLCIRHILSAMAMVIAQMMAATADAEAKRALVVALGEALNRHVPGMNASLGPGVTEPRVGKVH